MTARELLLIFHKKLVAAYRAAILQQDDRAWVKVAEYLSGLLIIQHAFGLREHRPHAVAFAEHQTVYGMGDVGPIETQRGKVDWDAIVPGPDLTDDWKKLAVPERRAMEELLSWVATTRPRWNRMVDAERREAFFITGIHRKGVLDASRKLIAKSTTLVQGPIGTAHALRELLPLGLERLETVVRTNMARARTQGEVEKWKQPHLLAAFPGARYRSTKGRMTRETHRAMDGFIILVEDQDFPLLVPPNGYNCVPIDTMILTDGGQKAIQDVRHGDMVWTHAGRWRPVTELHRNPTPNELVLVETDGGNTGLCLTANHRVLTEDGWIEAASLKVGHQVLKVSQSATNDVAGRDVDQTGQLEALQDGFVADAVNGRAGMACQLNAEREARKIEVEPIACNRLIEDERHRHVEQDVGERGLVARHGRPCVDVRRGVSMVVGDPGGRAFLHRHGPSEGGRRPQFVGYRLGAVGMTAMMQDLSGRAIADDDAGSLQDALRRPKGTSSLAADVGQRDLASAVARDGIFQAARPADFDAQLCLSEKGRRTVWLFPHGGSTVTVKASRVNRILRVPARSPLVYNLAVADDHSYTANGIVVHNCTCWLERLTRRQCENEGLLEKNSDKVLTWKKWPSTIAAENWSRGLFPDKGFKHAKVR